MTSTAKITEHFKLNEFTKGTSTNEYQNYLIKILAEELEKVRFLLNLSFNKRDASKDISMSITSGVRTPADYDRLLKSGYNPSKNSDHFYGYQPGCKPTLGAADIQFSNIFADYDTIFKYLKAWSEQGLISFGQIILEYNPTTKNYWIHFSNDPKKIFKCKVVDEVISRKKYLISRDNGHTYVEA